MNNNIMLDIGYDKSNTLKNKLDFLTNEKEKEKEKERQCLARFKKLNNEEKIEIKEKVLNLAKKKYGIFWDYKLSKQICFVEVMCNYLCKE